MKKILIAVVILAFVWAIPAVRAKVVAAAAPVLELLGPVGAKVLSPSRRYATQNEVMAIARVIKADEDEGKPVPEPGAFRDWLRRRLVHEDGIDVWGNAFWMRRSLDTVTVGSNGPDGERNTSDDVMYAIKL